MTTILAVPVLYERVVQSLADDDYTVACSFGWREPVKQTNQGFGRANRMVWEPGVNLKVGTYGGAKRPGRNPRPIASLDELVSVYVWAHDVATPNSEIAQYTAARLLHDAVVRAIHLSALAVGLTERIGYTLSDPEWVRDNVERVFGAELRFTLHVDSSIVDSVHHEISAGSGVAYDLLNPAEDLP